MTREQWLYYDFYGIFKFTGMLCLALNIHLALLSILRNNRCQENNVRDLTIGYSLTTFTYMAIGFLFYLCFPLAKTCIADDIINNFENADLVVAVARIFILFQMGTVFPLLVYLMRTYVVSIFEYVGFNPKDENEDEQCLLEQSHEYRELSGSFKKCVFYMSNFVLLHSFPKILKKYCRLKVINFFT